jgi:hypothetical protein
MLFKKKTRDLLLDTLDNERDDNDNDDNSGAGAGVGSSSLLRFRGPLQLVFLREYRHGRANYCQPARRLVETKHCETSIKRGSRRIEYLPVRVGHDDSFPIQIREVDQNSKRRALKNNTKS